MTIAAVLRSKGSQVETIAADATLFDAVAPSFKMDPDTCVLEGFRLSGDLYQPVTPNSPGRIASEQLGVELGLWQGFYENQERTWVRLFYPDGRLVPTKVEAARQRTEAARQHADAEHQRAEAARQRADAAEAELARLRALLGKG